MCERDLVYDVGLHKGEDTDYYLKKGFRVVAFEADPALAAQCRERFADSIARGRLIIVEGALAPPDHGDRITFYRSSSSVHGTIEARWNERNRKLGTSSQRIEVARADFVDALHAYGIPYFLKVDIEGVDQYIIESLGGIPVRPQHVSIESEKVDFADLTRELVRLRELGYDRFRAVQQESIPGSKLFGKDLDGAEFEHVFAEHSSGPFGTDLQQPWRDLDEVLEEYKRIFTFYRLFGDASPLRRVRGSYRALKMLGRMVGRPLPGWFDTHASR